MKHLLRSALPLLGHWLLASLPLLLMLAAMHLFLGSLESIDMHWRVHRLEHPDFRRFMDIFTDWGHLPLYFILLWMLVRGWRRGIARDVRYVLTFAVLQAFVGFLLVRMMKIGFGKPRPDTGGLARPITMDPSYHGMPSGHTTESFGAALSAVFGLKRWWLTPLLGCYAAATAFSRVYFSNHDSLDLLMGWLLGSYVAFGAAFLADVRWRNIFRISTWT